MSHAYPDDDPLAALYIATFDGAMPKSTLSGAGEPRHWQLAAHAAATAAIARAILAEQAAATASQTQTP
jgi:hypothetical protein